MIYLLIISLIFIHIITVDPNPLPSKFTQTFTAFDDIDKVCTGKIFYDALLLAQRINIINTGPSCCGVLDTDIKTCSYMQIDKKGYILSQQIKQCCIIQRQKSIIPQDIFNTFQYNGTRIIGGFQCYKWIIDMPQQGKVLVVYTDQTNKRILNSIEIIDASGKEQYGGMDFWQGTYSQRFNDTSTFQVPDYCQQKCSDKKIKQFMQSRINKILLSSYAKQTNKQYLYVQN